MNHIVVRVYPDLSYISNRVAHEHLGSHIQYNKDFRPGVSLFVDGEIVTEGIGFSEKKLEEAKGIARKASRLPEGEPTIPYR